MSSASTICSWILRFLTSLSFFRFIQGGFVTTGARVPDSEAADVYILSLPSFHWFKVNNPSGGARAFPTCDSDGTNQMIIVGGYDYNYNLDTRLTENPDPWTQQIAVFDMTALQWKERLEASASPYVAPDMVKQFYKNS